MEKVETIFIYSSKLKSKATDVFGMFKFIDLRVWHQPRRSSRQKKVGLTFPFKLEIVYLFEILFRFLIQFTVSLLIYYLLNLSTKNVLSWFNIYIERCKKLQCLAIMLCNKNSTYVAHGGSCRRPTTPRLVAQTSRETTSTDSDTAYFFIQLFQYW